MKLAREIAYKEQDFVGNLSLNREDYSMWTSVYEYFTNQEHDFNNTWQPDNKSC